MSARVSSGKDSKQNYGTPWNLFLSIQKYFPCFIDLAADDGNHKCPGWFGPGAGKGFENSFDIHWNLLRDGENNPWLFLKPEYRKISPWYAKCVHESNLGAKIVSLVPMDSAAEWFDYVPGNAGIWHLQGRVKFDGAKDSNSKDSALHIWHPDYVGQFRVWDWKRDKFLI